MLPPPPDVAKQLIQFIGTAKRTNSEALEVVSFPEEVHIDFMEAGVGTGFALPAEVGGAVYDWLSARAGESDNLDLSTCGGKGLFRVERFMRLGRPGVRIHTAHAHKR